jgi:ribosomal protein L23
VAFKTTPNVTKLEIKGLLESVYGMKVERVHTINYLGRKHVTYKLSNGGRGAR